MIIDKYLRVKQVTSRTGLSRATIYNMMRDGTFPLKTALGPRAIGWLESEIVTWMDGRKVVAKVGLEARPGAKPTIPKPGTFVRESSAKRSSVGSAPKEALPQGKGTSTTSIEGDWETEEPLPSASSTNALHEGLLTRKSSIKKVGTPVQGRTISTEIRPGAKKTRIAPSGVRHDIHAASGGQKKK